MTGKCKNFIENHIDHIEKNEWDEVFSSMANDMVVEFIQVLNKADVDFLSKNQYNLNNIFVRSTNGCDISNVKLDSLESLQKLLLSHRVRIGVDYANEIITIIVFDQTKDPWGDNAKQAELFDYYSRKTFQKAKNGSFKDIIHFVMYHAIDKICLKPKRDIEKQVQLDSSKNHFVENDSDSPNKANESDITEYLGCFISDRCEVWLCEELINECARQLAQNKEFVKKVIPGGDVDENSLFQTMQNTLYEKIFTHEFGHLVFSWGKSKKKEEREKQANYFSSYILDGKLDLFIKNFTNLQPVEYHNPYLIGDKRADSLYC